MILIQELELAFGHMYSSAWMAAEGRIDVKVEIVIYINGCSYDLNIFQIIDT